jgi:hypothetical protein
MTDNPRETVYALALLAIVRKAKHAYDIEPSLEFDDDSIQAVIPGLRTEVRNIMLEHLTTEQLADTAAEKVSISIADILQEFCMLSLALKGRIDMNHIIATTETYCSEKLGREVKV